MIGGNRIASTFGACTVGFKAKYQGKTGFYTAGHCVNGTGKNIGQPTLLKKLGESIFNSDAAITNCDCAFIEITEDNKGIDPFVFAPNVGFHTVTSTDSISIGDMVLQYGSFSRTSCGSVINQPWFQTYVDGTVRSGLAATDITSTIFGDSGGPVLNDNGTKLKGFIQGIETLDGVIIKTFVTRQSRVALKLGSTFSWDFSTVQQ